MIIITAGGSIIVFHIIRLLLLFSYRNIKNSRSCLSYAVYINIVQLIWLIENITCWEGELASGKLRWSVLIMQKRASQPNGEDYPSKLLLKIYSADLRLFIAPIARYLLLRSYFLPIWPVRPFPANYLCLPLSHPLTKAIYAYVLGLFVWVSLSLIKINLKKKLDYLVICIIFLIPL